MRILTGCRMREMVSDIPFMHGIVAVIVGVVKVIKRNCDAEHRGKRPFDLPTDDTTLVTLR